MGGGQDRMFETCLRVCSVGDESGPLVARWEEAVPLKDPLFFLMALF